jgi:hypothetical protein|tara:strand:+ start:1448 stop:2119 length:672 start_codon:yes stop_codon:yes gene_type:complete
MNKHGRKINKIIEYLVDVYTEKDFSAKGQNFFRTLPKLDELINSYFRDFENSDERNKAIAHKLETLNKLSFDKNDEGYTLYKDTTRKSSLNLSKDEHLKYASSIYHQFKDSFINKLREEGIDVSENPYPLIFVSGTVYHKFLKYTKKHIIDPYLDYSYLKKRLEDEGLIHRTKDNEFMKVLFKDMKVINERDYDKYLLKNKLTSLGKSNSEQRLNNYNNIFLS